MSNPAPIAPAAGVPPLDLPALQSALARAVGAQHVHADADTVALHSHDIWARGSCPVALVVAPGDTAQLVEVVRLAGRAGQGLVVRGGGMSYTQAFVPAPGQAPAGVLSLDMSRMAAVLDIRPEDMTVTVQPGCTWAALREALEPLGLRTPFWGPMSGLMSTVGGGISQHAAMLGASQHGISADSVVGLTVVLANGELLRTGAGAGDGQSPFFRHYGPDLTGLFCGDCGTLGVKAEITLRLIRRPPHEGHASFEFDSADGLLRAMAEMSRAGLASEMCGFDPDLTRVRMQRASLGSDVKTLGKVMGREGSLVKGLMAAGKMALAGRDFVGAQAYSLHVVLDGRHAAAVQADLAEARRIAAEQQGREIANTIAKVIRAMPFPPLNSVLGPCGERWLPVHGVCALSVGPALFRDIGALFGEMAADFQRLGVRTGTLFSAISTNALLIEPVFYWPGEPLPIHAVAMEPAHRARLPVLSHDAEATALVAQARRRLIEVFQRHRCGHFQIGRTYPYAASRDTASHRLLQALRQSGDPLGLLNPGALGLATH